MKKKIILIVGLYISAVIPSYGMTASEIITRVRTNVRDQSTVSNRQQFSDATFLNYLNDGQRESNIMGWLLQDNVVVTLSSGTREYSLPVDFLATDRVIVSNSKLDQTSLNQLDADFASWLTATATKPQRYYLYRTTTTVIGFYPKPSGTSLPTATIYYIKQPVELTSTSQTPWNGWNSLTPYHTALVYYVTYRSFIALEETDLANVYYQEWVNAVQTLRQGVSKMPDFNPGFIGQRK